MYEPLGLQPLPKANPRLSCWPRPERPHPGRVLLLALKRPSPHAAPAQEQESEGPEHLHPPAQVPERDAGQGISFLRTACPCACAAPASPPVVPPPLCAERPDDVWPQDSEDREKEAESETREREEAAALRGMVLSYCRGVLEGTITAGIDQHARSLAREASVSAAPSPDAPAPAKGAVGEAEAAAAEGGGPGSDQKLSAAREGLDAARSPALCPSPLFLTPLPSASRVGAPPPRSPVSGWRSPLLAHAPCPPSRLLRYWASRRWGRSQRRRR